MIMFDSQFTAMKFKNVSENAVSLLNVVQTFYDTFHTYMVFHLCEFSCAFSSYVHPQNAIRILHISKAFHLCEYASEFSDCFHVKMFFHSNDRHMAFLVYVFAYELSALFHL